MRGILKSFFVAFSLYSAIPMPFFQWDKTNMKYVFCFFPLVGLVVGGSIAFWYEVAMKFMVSVPLFAAASAIIPILISGGIHFDGYLDTCDAISSRGDIAKKQAILKDSHIGAFGVIFAIVYFLLLFGLYSEFYVREGSILLLVLAFFMSRSLGAFASFYIQPSKSSGLLYTFTDVGAKKVVLLVSAFYVIISLGFIAYFLSITVAIFTFVLIFLSFLFFKRLCIKEFGGISGDLAGFYIQLSELLLLAIAAFGG